MQEWRICPSILNADLNNLESEILKVSSVSEYLHLDIMDNIFVPNITFDIERSEEIIGFSPLPVDVHLMISEPELTVARYCQAGAASVTFHWEATASAELVIERIQENGSRVGLAIKPKTPLTEVSHLLSKIDMLLIMTVEPGFGGQSFMTEMMPKVSSARTIIDLMPAPRPWIQVDGGISLATIETAANAGADTFVAGSAVFKAPIPAQMILDMKKVLESVRLG
ncbi:MAG: ribulose-phosphate 3-epimerase [Actinomycetes bacterium]|jgi:ribulose-phosphate 3-epimerase